MFKIGSLTIANRVVSAPMAGISDLAFRRLARSFGCGLVCSEMISAKGLVYGQDKTLSLAELDGESGPVSLQIFGSEPDIMARAATLLVNKTGASIIDINMGCPTPKIVKNGEGSALLQNLALCREIIGRVAAAVTVPVTVKMRRGWEDGSEACLELAQIAEQEGAQAVILHPRSRAQFFSGRAEWTFIRKTKEIVSIPVIGNGDIGNAGDALNMLESTGCDAVMVGRGSLGNPFLFRDCVNLLEKGLATSSPAIEERLDTAFRHLDMVCRQKGEYTGVREMRKHMAWYIKGLPGATRLRRSLNQATSVSDMKNLLMTLKSGFKDDYFLKQ